MSTAHEGKGAEEATQTIVRECRKFKEERRCDSQFSDDLQTSLIGQLCLAALQEPIIKIRDPNMSITCLL